MQSAASEESARLLVVDDDPLNLFTVRALLEEYGYRVACASDGVAALEHATRHPPDLVITDVFMPRMDGFALCRAWKEDPHLRHVPVIFYTATFTDPRDEELALRLGAERFLVKPIAPAELVRVVDEVLAEARPAAQPSVTARSRYFEDYSAAVVRKLESKIAELERARDLGARQRERLELLHEVDAVLAQCTDEDRLDPVAAIIARAVPGARCEIWLTQQDWEHLYLRGTDDDVEWGKSRLARIGREDPLARALATRNQPRVWHGSEPGQIAGSALCAGRRFGTLLAAPLVGRGERCGFLLLWHDEQRRVDDGAFPLLAAIARQVAMAVQTGRLQSWLAQSRKMDAVARLAGGVAHEFNNALTAIIGTARVLLEEGELPAMLEPDIQEILSAAERGAQVADELSLFTRAHGATGVVQLGPLISEIAPRLRETCRSLEIELAEEDLPVHGEREHLVRMISALVAHAAAMTPADEPVLLCASRVAIGSSPEQSLLAGEYVVLSVEDHGDGFDVASLPRVFEPYPIGTRTQPAVGLGLAPVYSLARQYGGDVVVESGIGFGTTIRVRLPRARAAERRDRSVRERGALVGRGTETVLVVDDEELVRNLVRRVLVSRGYRVLCADDGVTGTQAVSELGDRIDLVLADLVMPRLDGESMVRRINEQGFRGRILYMTGHAHRAQPLAVPAGQRRIDCLRKPFTPEALMAAVRDILDDPDVPAHME